MQRNWFIKKKKTCNNPEYTFVFSSKEKPDAIWELLDRIDLLIWATSLYLVGAGLFKRAILMSGSAMSADAIGKAPLQITKQVKKAA